MNAKHSSDSNEHYTPAEIVDRSRYALGDNINLDPASCEVANRYVKAERYYSLEDDGLSKPWERAVFLNPPGGALVAKKESSDEWKAYAYRYGEKFNTRSHAVAFWRKLMNERMIGRTKAAVFIGFSIEILQTAQSNGWLSPLDFSICVPKTRICFVNEFGQPGKAPTHSSVIVHFGPEWSTERFNYAFKDLGKVVINEPT